MLSVPRGSAAFSDQVGGEIFQGATRTRGCRAPRRRGTKATSPRDDNRFSLREVEADFRAAVDPYADAVVILSKPDGETLDVEEGYLTFNRLPFPPDQKLPLGLGIFQRAVAYDNAVRLDTQARLREALRAAGPKLRTTSAHDRFELQREQTKPA